jgi:disulfide oxidoreductase YuzD
MKDFDYWLQDTASQRKWVNEKPKSEYDDSEEDEPTKEDLDEMEELLKDIGIEI